MSRTSFRDEYDRFLLIKDVSCEGALNDDKSTVDLTHSFGGNLFQLPDDIFYA
jgi:hypothetical protein